MQALNQGRNVLTECISLAEDYVMKLFGLLTKTQKVINWALRNNLQIFEVDPFSSDRQAVIFSVTTNNQ